MRIRYWSSDVCSSDLHAAIRGPDNGHARIASLDGVDRSDSRRRSVQARLLHDEEPGWTGALRRQGGVPAQPGQVVVPPGGRPRRPDERRVGEEGVRSRSTRWATYQQKKKKKNK